VILTQVDDNGRNPVHYCSSNKFTRSNKTAITLLNIGLENEEGYEEF